MTFADKPGYLLGSNFQFDISTAAQTKSGYTGQTETLSIRNVSNKHTRTSYYYT